MERQIYIATGQSLFAGRECYPGAAVRADSCPGEDWELYDPARHGAEPLVLDHSATVAESCRTVAL
jgi:hypothetical protein